MYLRQRQTNEKLSQKCEKFHQTNILKCYFIILMLFNLLTKRSFYFRQEYVEKLWQ